MVDFLDYYYDMLSYLHLRKQRLELFKNDCKLRGITDQAYLKEFRHYSGKERVYLRKRRTRLRVTNFHIVDQIGQGGYGQVFLSRHKPTGELVALKRMEKKAIKRMGEVQHILTERDILTRTKSRWLVKLMYAFQDMDHIYLAMVFLIQNI